MYSKLSSISLLLYNYHCYPPLDRTAYAMVNFWYEQVSMRMDQCEHVVSNSTIMNTLNATSYDLVLADPSVMCGELIAHKLKVPFVYNVRIASKLHFQELIHFSTCLR